MAKSRSAKNNSSSSSSSSCNAKLCLEEYLLLLQSRSHSHLTVAHLNQIIKMHGYKKIHKVHKKLLSDAVNSIDLVTPCRSTLRDFISPPVTTKMDDVTADLTDINWPECCVTSVQTLSTRSSHEDHSNGAVRFQTDSAAAHSVVVSAPVTTSRKRSVRKRKRTAREADLVNFTLP